jgi:hypothetical protein
MSTTEHEFPPLMGDVLRFYVEHPGVAETPEGLARWRLLEQYVESTMRETTDAVDWLVEHGFLHEVAARRGAPLFMLNTERRSEAEALLNTSKERGRGRR